MSPLAADSAAMVEEAVALARSEVARIKRMRRYPQWRRDIEPEFERLERVMRQVLAEAPANSRVKKLARYEPKALERMREDEANVATRDEVQILEISRIVLQAAEAARVAAAELDAAMVTAPAQAGGSGPLPPQEAAVVTVEAAGNQLHAAVGAAWCSVSAMGLGRGGGRGY